MRDNAITYQRKIIGVEKNLGFLYVPAEARALMPSETGIIVVQLAGEGKQKELSYNADYNRIFGLTNWYKKNTVQVGSLLTVVVSEEKVSVSIAKESIIEESIEIPEPTEASIDISGLSSQAKGNIGEDRVKEIILLYSQGLFNVYKPVIDNRGIDLIILKEGIFLPIYLQVKTRYNVSKNDQLTLTISGNTFKSHHAFYIVGISFNPTTFEVDDKILLLPSKDLVELGIQLNHKNSLRVSASYTDKTKSKFARFFVSKEEFVEKLMEKFEAMSELIK